MTTLTSSWQEIYRTSKNTGYGNQYVIFYAYATENIADNSSTIHTLIRTTVEGSGSYVSVSSWDVASDTSSNSGGFTTWYAGNDYNLLESAWAVSHNADGTGTVSIGMAFHATYNITSVDYRVTVGLQTIPRASNITLSVSSVVLNGSSGVTIYTNRASSSFTHTIQQNFSGSFSNIATGVGDSYTWVPPTDWYSTIGNGSKAFTVRLITYSGSTQIGYTDTSFTVTSAGISPASLSTTSITLNGSNGVTISTNKKSSSFTHKIQQNFSGTFVDIATGVVDSTSWAPPTSYYSTLGGDSKNFIIRCITYSGSTLIGQVDKSFTLNSAGADAVSLSETNMTMGTAYTINISKKISDFRHTVTWVFKSANGQLGATQAVDTSVGWTPSTDLSAQILTSMSGNGTVTCQTFYGTTSIGSTSINFTLSVPTYNVVLGTPTITEEGTDAKSPANALTTYGVDNTEVVAIMSVKRLVVSASTSYNATISNISVTFGGAIKTSNSSSFNNTFSGMLNGTLSITATDSRGRALATTYTQSYTFRNYFLPSVTSFNGDRTTQTGDTGTLNASGTFWNATAGTTANTLTGAISNAATGTTTIVPNSNNWSTSFPVSGVTYTNSYDFTITVTDSFGNKATKNYTLTASAPVMWKGKRTVRIYNNLVVKNIVKAVTFIGNLKGNADTATYATSAGSIPLNKIYPVGSIYLTLSSTSPASLFGGTWTQLTDRFLLGAGNTYGISTTGGEVTHTLTISEMPTHNHGIGLEKTDGGYLPKGSTPSSVISNCNAQAYGSQGTFSDRIGTKNYDSAFIQNNGGGNPHNNMPPYLAVYMWKRVS